MTETEFSDWLAAHCAMHPEFHSWLAKFPETKAGTKSGELSLEDLTPNWFKVLSHATLDDAKEASQAMYRDAELLPRAFSRHPAAVARLARRKVAGREAARPQRIDGQETVRCRQCGDDGVVQVWDGASMQAAKDGRLGRPRTIYAAVARCSCQAADKWHWIDAVFNPRRMLPVDQLYLTEPKEQQKLIDFVAAMKPAGYREEFVGFEG